MNAVETALWGNAPEKIRNAIRRVGQRVAEGTMLPEIADDWAHILWLEACRYSPQQPSPEHPDAHRVLNPLYARWRSIEFYRSMEIDGLRREASRIAAGAMLRGRPVQATQEALNRLCASHELPDGYFDEELSEEVAWYLKGFAQQEALVMGGHAR